MAVEHRVRVANADRTGVLLKALVMLEKTDFETMMGSGILVRLTPITEERHLADEFMLSAEDMAPIAPLFAKSIRKYLERRQVMLRSEIGEIDKALAAKSK